MANKKQITKKASVIEDTYSGPYSSLPRKVEVEVVIPKLISKYNFKKELFSTKRAGFTIPRRKRGEESSPSDLPVIPAEIIRQLESDLSTDVERVSLAPKSTFWANQSVKIVNKITLNLRDPEDIIKYYVLMANSNDIATSTTEFVTTKSNKKVLMRDTKTESISKVSKEKEAFEFLKVAYELQLEDAFMLLSIIDIKDHIESTEFTDEELESKYMDRVKLYSNMDPKTSPERILFDSYLEGNKRNGLITKGYQVLKHILSPQTKLRKLGAKYYYENQEVGSTIEEIIKNLDLSKFADLSMIIYNS